jgi:hypothetical protein
MNMRRTPSAALCGLLLLAVACHVDALLSGGETPGGGGGPGTGIDSLVQLQGDSATPVPTGGSIPIGDVVVGAVVMGDSQFVPPLRLEVEVEPAGTAFRGQASAESDPVSPGSHAYARLAGLANSVAYRWQARAVDAGLRTGPWQVHGGSPDFLIAAQSSHLRFVTQPSTITAGQTMAPVTVALVDAGGGTITSFSGTVFLDVATGPSGGVMGTRSANAAFGVATFSDVSLTVAGTYRLAATADSAAGATSLAFGVNPAALDHLGFLVQPSSTRQNEPMTPAVQVAAQDQYDNVVTSFTGTVFIWIGTDPSGGATLDPAGTQRAATAGVATFEALRIDKPGNGYTLVNGVPNARGGTSRSFDITP